MPYNSIITLRKMPPAYNIQKESPGAWKLFITNEHFNELLTKVIRAVQNNDADTHKSIWIAGTYGSGKSHAGAVIQHLLCDPIEEIEEYVNEEYRKEKYEILKNSIFQLRQVKRLFPVHLYGQQNISHEEDLSLQVQKEVKQALINANIDIVVQTDFDIYVEHIEAQTKFWGDLIDGNALLKSIAPDIDILKKKLGSTDTDVLDAVRKALREGGFEIRIKNNKLHEWLFEVQNELRETTDYNGLLIIWDEFTDIIKCPIGLALLKQLQLLNESMMDPKNDSYFLFISHPSALNTLQDAEREQTKGRYHYVVYNMEPVSAFKIMSKKFMIVDPDLYEKRQKRFFNLHQNLLDQFSQTGTNEEETKENIRNLYPLHPATANLATYFAREAGSSSRSVFEFLACDRVKDFLENEDVYNNEQTITADYLWDYVKEYFESDTMKYGAVTERYNSHHLQVESQGENYARAFKGILLLNALNNIANSDTVTPSTENIEGLFAGTETECELAEILDFFNEKSIIQRQPNGNFSILFTALPTTEIQELQNKLKNSDYLYTEQVIKQGDTAETFFKKNLSQVARPLQFRFFSQVANDYTLNNKIENAAKEVQPYETFLAIMVARNNQELLAVKNFVTQYSGDGQHDGIVYLIMNAIMGDKEYDRFVEYIANAQCAQSHNLPQQHQTYLKQAAELLSEWFGKMKSGLAEFYLGGAVIAVPGGKLTSTINSAIAPALFTSGPESLDLIKTKSSTTYWAKKSVKTTVDVVLNYNTKQEIIDKCGGPAQHVGWLLQDSVDDNLQWKATVSPDHPLKKVCDYVEEYLSGKHTNRNQSFNLGDKLIGLTQRPFGLFQTYAPMAMVAFAMRKYINVIYDTNGKPRTSKHLVDDVVELFAAWEKGKTSNKLNFMFESKEAGSITKMLVKIFKLNSLPGYSDISSLKDARWAVQHEYTKAKNYPLWALKYCNDSNLTEDIKTFFDNVMKVVSDPESMKNPSLLDETKKGYDENKLEIGNVLMDSNDNFRKGFENYLKSENNVKLLDSEIDDARKYLDGHLEGEVGLWSESGVTDALKNWRLSQSNPTSATIPGLAVPSVSNGPVPHPSNGNVLRQKRVTAKNRLQNAPNLTQALEKLIDAEEEYIIDILLKYV